MNSYRPPFAIVVLLSMLLHSGAYMGISGLWGTADKKTITDKLIVVTLQSKPKLDVPIVAEPELVKEVEKEPEIVKVAEEESEVETEDAKSVEVTEAKHNMFSNSDKNASNNQTIKGKTEFAGFGTTVKIKKPKKPEASSQIKALDPKKDPIKLNQKKEELEVKKLVETKDKQQSEEIEKVIEQIQVTKTKDVKDGKAKKKVEEIKEKKSLKRIVTATTEKTTVSSIDDASTGKSDKNKIVKAEKAQVPKKPKPKPQTIAKLEPEILDIMTGKVSSKGIDVTKIIDEEVHLKEGVGNMKILSDSSLRGTKVKQPYSETKSKELERVNIFLERMEKQLRSLWVNPYKGRELHQGTIKLVLNENGYLQNVYVYRSSGIAQLDESFETAIRSVPRFDVPKDKVLVNRYYKNLTFHYSSIKVESELMPFELERTNQ